MARNDPFWLNARFTGGNCPKCSKEHRKGDRVFFYPVSRRAFCADCGKHAEQDFRMHSEADSF